jgi:2-polyprenyl-3-methyl-5-hydroxy-6-metoxy-1,4-benzoquinol methylase
MVRLGAARLEGCAACGSWTWLPRPTPQQQAAVHDNAEYFEHPYFQERRRQADAVRRRCRLAFEHITAVVPAERLRGRRLLDVGCDTGALLRAAQELYGVVPVGLDIASRAVAEARASGVEAYCCDLEAAPSQVRNMPVITAIDLVEHVVDPEGFLRQVRARLAPGGVAYLETPNIRSLVYRTGRLLHRLTGGRPRPTFERLFPAQHVQYFTERGFAVLAEKAGLEVARLDKRVLPRADLATSRVVGLGLTALQLLDRVFGTPILLCAVLRRPA